MFVYARKLLFIARKLLLSVSDVAHGLVVLRNLML